jgi:diphthamide synthase (EF-2-diphthine--ammonia ligase)
VPGTILHPSVEDILMPESIRWIFDFLIATGLTAGVVSAAVVWVSKEWLSQRIKSQIESEYEHRLESYKAQLKGEYD